MPSHHYVDKNIIVGALQHRVFTKKTWLKSCPSPEMLKKPRRLILHLVFENERLNFSIILFPKSYVLLF